MITPTDAGPSFDDVDAHAERRDWRVRMWAAVRFAFFGAVLLYVFVATFPELFVPLAPGLDPGWRWGINEAAAQHIRFGRDINFTYGPLGFLLEPIDVGSNLVLAVGFWVVLQLAFVAVLWRTFVARKSLIALVAFAAAFVCGLFLGFPVEYQLLMVLGLLLAHALEAERREAMVCVAFAAALAGAAPFMKFTFGMAATAMLAVTLLLWLLKRRREALAGIAIAAGCYLAMWVLVIAVFMGGSLSSVGLWLRTSLELSNGYSVAMSTQPTQEVVRAGLLGAVLFVAVIALAGAIRAFHQAAVLLIFSPAVFLVFKHGFTRHGGRFALPFLIAVFGALILRSRRRSELALAAGALLFVGILLVPANCRDDTYPGGPCQQLNTHNLTGLRGLDQVRSTVRLGEVRADLRRDSDTALARDRLPPEFLRILAAEGGTVDVLPWELTFIPANTLRWSPNPILQTYQGYTTYLDRRSAEHLLGRGAPDYLIIHWSSINRRHPLLDTELTWKAILTNYRVVAESESHKHYLLRSQGIARLPAYSRLGRTTGSTGEWIDVPQTGGQLFARVRMRLRTAGSLRKLLYKIEPVFIDVMYDSGRVGRHRIVPDTMEGGMIIGDLPNGPASFSALLRGDPVPRVRAFRIHGPGTSSYRTSLDVVWEQLAG